MTREQERYKIKRCATPGGVEVAQTDAWPLTTSYAQGGSETASTTGSMQDTPNLGYRPHQHNQRETIDFSASGAMLDAYNYNEKMYPNIATFLSTLLETPRYNLHDTGIFAANAFAGLTAPKSTEPGFHTAGLLNENGSLELAKIHFIAMRKIFDQINPHPDYNYSCIRNGYKPFSDTCPFGPRCIYLLYGQIVAECLEWASVDDDDNKLHSRLTTYISQTNEDDECRDPRRRDPRRRDSERRSTYDILTGNTGKTVTNSMMIPVTKFFGMVVSHTCPYTHLPLEYREASAAAEEITELMVKGYATRLLSSYTGKERDKLAEGIARKKEALPQLMHSTHYACMDNFSDIDVFCHGWKYPALRMKCAKEYADFQCSARDYWKLTRKVAITSTLPSTKELISREELEIMIRNIPYDTFFDLETFFGVKLSPNLQKFSVRNLILANLNGEFYLAALEDLRPRAMPLEWNFVPRFVTDEFMATKGFKLDIYNKADVDKVSYMRQCANDLADEYITGDQVEIRRKHFVSSLNLLAADEKLFVGGGIYRNLALIMQGEPVGKPVVAAHPGFRK